MPLQIKHLLLLQTDKRAVEEQRPTDREPVAEFMMYQSVARKKSSHHPRTPYPQFGGERARADAATLAEGDPAFRFHQRPE